MILLYTIGIIKKYDNALAQDFYTYVMSQRAKKYWKNMGSLRLNKNLTLALGLAFSYDTIEL